MSANRSHPLSVSELQDCMRQRRPVDTSRLDRILRLDRDRSLVEVQAGVSWKALADRLRPGDARTRGLPTPCATVGQSIAWNAAGPDGRPTVTHVESLALVTPDGQLRRVDRLTNPQLFALVVGGQGLFGAVYSATLRLQSLSQTVSEAQSGSAASPAGEARAMELLVPPEQAQHLEQDVRAACREWRTATELLPPRRIDMTATVWNSRPCFLPSLSAVPPSPFTEPSTQTSRTMAVPSTEYWWLLLRSWRCTFASWSGGMIPQSSVPSPRS